MFWIEKKTTVFRHLKQYSNTPIKATINTFITLWKLGNFRFGFWYVVRVLKSVIPSASSPSEFQQVTLHLSQPGSSVPYWVNRRGGQLEESGRCNNIPRLKSNTSSYPQYQTLLYLLIYLRVWWLLFLTVELGSNPKSATSQELLKTKPLVERQTLLILVWSEGIPLSHEFSDWGGIKKNSSVLLRNQTWPCWPDAYLNSDKLGKSWRPHCPPSSTWMSNFILKKNTR